MKLLKFMAHPRLLLFVLLLAAGWACSGCGAESENTAQRPWNSPEGWQNGSAGMIAGPH